MEVEIKIEQKPPLVSLGTLLPVDTFLFENDLHGCCGELSCRVELKSTYYSAWVIRFRDMSVYELSTEVRVQKMHIVIHARF